MDILSYYTRPRSNGQSFSSASLTQQSAANECDINKIIARYRSTGLISHITGRRPLYGDFYAIGDFSKVQAKMLLAQDSFEQLSSTVRKRFHNDPAEFIAFVQDRGNYEEAVKLGLIDKPKDVSEAPVVPKGGTPASASAPEHAASVASPEAKKTKTEQYPS